MDETSEPEDRNLTEDEKHVVLHFLRTTPGLSERTREDLIRYVIDDGMALKECLGAGYLKYPNQSPDDLAFDDTASDRAGRIPAGHDDLLAEITAWVLGDMRAKADWWSGMGRDTRTLRIFAKCICDKNIGLPVELCGRLMDLQLSEADRAEFVLPAVEAAAAQLGESER